MYSSTPPSRGTWGEVKEGEEELGEERWERREDRDCVPVVPVRCAPTREMISSLESRSLSLIQRSTLVRSSRRIKLEVIKLRDNETLTIIHP